MYFVLRALLLATLAKGTAGLIPRVIRRGVVSNRIIVRPVIHYHKECIDVRHSTLLDAKRYDDEEFWEENVDDQRRSRNRRLEKRNRDIEGKTPGLAGDLEDAYFGIIEFLRGSNLMNFYMRFVPKGWENFSLIVLFVSGVSLGAQFDSGVNADPKDISSRVTIDRAAPNPDVCQAYGSSAVVLDQRVFVTFNPFNIYVTQVDTKPGCVLRPSNVVPVLKSRKLLEDPEVLACKNKVNTWAFVGDLNDKPQLSCVYPSTDAQNEFLSNPKMGIGEDVYDDDPSYMKPGDSALSYMKRVKE